MLTMINLTDLNLKDPDSVKNLPKELLSEISDGRDPSEIKNNYKKKGDKKHGSTTKVH